jgi:DNA-directed RNA polymerase specialized sigma24 family protein
MLNSGEENNRRLKNLYTESHSWLMAAAYNITKDKNMAEELISDLYLYLAEKVNPSIWWGDNSMNLMYCHSFIKTRYINKIKAGKRMSTISPHYDVVEDEYDVEFDKDLENAYNGVIEELKAMERTKLWPASKLYQMYVFTEGMTLEKLSNEIHISKSTSFLQVRKCKKHLRETIANPFKK